MSRSRKWWHKCNHDRIMRDQLCWSLPDEALGLLKRLECLVGSTECGHETGILHTEAGEKMPVSKLMLIFSRGDSAGEALIVQRLNLLARAEQICPRALARGQIKLIHWDADQEMPANADGNRKRSKAEEREATDAVAFRGHLERLFARLGQSVVTEGDVLSIIKAARGGYPKTQNRFLQFLFSEGVLTRDREGHVALAALASPAPAGIGFSGFGDTPKGEAGAGVENFPDGKFPIEIDPEPEKDPEKRMGYHSQLDSAGAGGGAGEASAGFQPSGSKRPHCERPPKAPPAVRRMLPAQRTEDAEQLVDVGDVVRATGFALVEPGDAYRCPDPLASSIEFLSQCPGWQSKRSANRPSSAVALRGRWAQLRKEPDLGPEIGEQIWRTCLDQAITDRIERQGWGSWVAIFQSRIKRQVAVYKPIEVTPAAEETGGGGCAPKTTIVREQLR